MKTLPGLYELISGDLNLAGQIRPVQVEDVLGREPVEVDLGSIAEYLSRRDRPRHRRRRVDRRRALPPDRARRAGAARARRPLGAGALRHRARARRRARLLGGRDRARRLRRPRQDEPGLRALPAGRRLPRGRVQARRRCSRPTRSRQCATTCSRRDVMADVAVEYGTQRFVLVSTDKAANPKNLLGQSKALVRVDRRGLRPPRGHHDALRRRSLRQRPRLVRAA